MSSPVYVTHTREGGMRATWLPRNPIRHQRPDIDTHWPDTVTRRVNLADKQAYLWSTHTEESAHKRTTSPQLSFFPAAKKKKSWLSVSAKFQIPVSTVSPCVSLSSNTFTEPVKHRGAATPQRKAFITRRHPTFTVTVIWELVFVCVFVKRPHLETNFKPDLLIWENFTLWFPLFSFRWM